MPSTRKPHVAAERFLQPVFDDETGILRTTRMIEPGERADLTDVEATILGAKARLEVAPPDEPPARGEPTDVGP